VLFVWLQLTSLFYCFFIFMIQVTEISYSDTGVSLVTYSGAQLHADYVLVTVPLTLLKRHAIQFFPPLPDVKNQAIESFGIGVLEKVC
jgi:polyamine oxidase